MNMHLDGGGGGGYGGRRRRKKSGGIAHISVNAGH
jgi:hypothetical protein